MVAGATPARLRVTSGGKPDEIDRETGFKKTAWAHGSHTARRQIARSQPGGDVREVSQPCDLDKAAVCDEPALALSKTSPCDPHQVPSRKLNFRGGLFTYSGGGCYNPHGLRCKQGLAPRW